MNQMPTFSSAWASMPGFFLGVLLLFQAIIGMANTELTTSRDSSGASKGSVVEIRRSAIAGGGDLSEMGSNTQMHSTIGQSVARDDIAGASAAELQSGYWHRIVREGDIFKDGFE